MFRVSHLCAGFVAALALIASPSLAETITFDLSDDFVTPLANGAAVDSPAAFGNVFDLSSTGANLGSTVFDSSPAGPNAATADVDLLLDTGNILFLQSNDFPTQTVAGIFDTPNDSTGDGSITFDFAPAGFAVELTSIDVLDVDTNTSMELTLTDAAGRTRTISVPENYTGDIMDGEPGIATIDLGGAAQESPNVSGLFTIIGQASGFDLSDIASLEIAIDGSGALDNLVYVPEPATGLLMICGLVGLARRRR